MGDALFRASIKTFDIAHFAVRSGAWSPCVYVGWRENLQSLGNEVISDACVGVTHTPD